MFNKIFASEPQHQTNETVKKSRSNLALVGLAITGGLAVGVSLVTFSFVSPALRRICLPFVPATDNQIKNVLKLCNKKQLGGGSGTTLVDLGSGDGRIVFAAAREGYQATGYELNPWLVLYSKVYARFQNLAQSTSFKRKDLWKVDYGQFDNVVIFGVADMMNELSVKLEEDMNDDCRVVACRFEIPRWKPIKEIQDGVDSAWLYTKESFQDGCQADTEK